MLKSSESRERGEIPGTIARFSLVKVSRLVLEETPGTNARFVLVKVSRLVLEETPGTNAREPEAEASQECARIRVQVSL